MPGSSSNYGGASAQAIELTLIVALLMAFYFWLEKRLRGVRVRSTGQDHESKTQKTILDIVTYSLLILGAVIMVLPFLWMISTSFKLPADQFTKTLIPNPATLNNIDACSAWTWISRCCS